jgi:salicylate hydroxylase
MSNNPRIAIVGGGIGGLTLALALRQRGIEAGVYEQAPELAEIGAAVALSANATRELARLGLLDALTAVSTEPSELIYRNWRDGRRIAAHPVHEKMSYQGICGAPYCGIHRADLQRILSGALGGAGLHLDHRLTEVRDLGRVTGLSFANGRTVEADLVVGADGVRSLVRRFITGADDTVYSGTSAFRGIVPVTKLPTLPDPRAIQFWVGPDAHLLHYAIGGDGEFVNFFAVVEYPKAWPHADKWLDPVEPGEAVAAFKDWHPAVIEMVAQHSPVRWGLFGTRPLLHW